MTPSMTFALLAMLAWGLWGFFSKLAVAATAPRGVFLAQIAGVAIVTVALLLFGGLRLETTPRGLVPGVVSGVFLALGLLAFSLALANGKASIIVPLTALYPVVTIFLALLLLQESLSRTQVSGVALALAAAVLLSR